MSNTWRACSRPQDHRIHRTQAEADNCPFDRNNKHSSQFPDYPPLRRRSAPRPATPRATHPATPYRAATAVTVDDEDDARQSPASFAPALPTTPPSSSSDQSRSRPSPASSGSTPGVETQQQAYPTPLTQPAVRPSTPVDELAGGMPLSRLRLRELDARQAKSATPTSFVAESPRPGSEASAALPGVVQSIEVGHTQVASSQSASATASGSVQVPATIAEEHTIAEDQPRADTPKTLQINYLRQLAHDLTCNLREQIALSHRLFTRKEVEAAGRQYAEAKVHAEEMRRHGTEAELQLAHDQLEACQRAFAAAEARAEYGVTARGVLEVLLRVCAVVMILWWAWCWVNRVENEYINGRMRAHYGLV